MKEIFLILFILFNRLPAETRGQFSDYRDGGGAELLDNLTSPLLFDIIEDGILGNSEEDTTDFLFNFIKELKNKKNKTPVELSFSELCNLNNFFNFVNEDSLFCHFVECKRHGGVCVRMNFESKCEEQITDQKLIEASFRFKERLKKNKFEEEETEEFGEVFYGLYKKNGETAIVSVNKQAALLSFYLHGCSVLDYANATK